MILPIEPEAAEWVEGYIKPDMNVFEYGSGPSTAYFSDRARKIISVECYPEKFEMHKRYSSSLMQLIAPTENPKPFPYSHESYSSTDKEFAHLSFKKYVNHIKKHRNGFFDIVFINGRSRASCIMTAVPKIKKDGILILNDSERYEYKNAIELFLKEYPHQLFGEGTRKTGIWTI